MQLTHTFVGVIMNQKCAADTESVFVARAAVMPTTLTMGSSVNAVISAVISTKDCSVEVWVTHRQPLSDKMCHTIEEVMK